MALDDQLFVAANIAANTLLPIHAQQYHEDTLVPHPGSTGSDPGSCILPNELNTFYARFDIVKEESAVKSTLPSVDEPLSISPADVRGNLFRVNVSNPARPDKR